MAKKYRTITEARAVELFEKHFGTGGIKGRITKLKEEYSELMQAIEENEQNPTPDGWEHVKDEISDLYCVLSHLASKVGLYNQELLEMGIDKVTNRQTNPDYKRFK